MKKVRFLVIGVGRMGAEWDIPLDKHYPKTHCGAIILHKEAELAGVVDVDRKQLSRVSNYFKVPGFSSLKQALKNGVYDAAVISTPENHRFDLIRELCGEVKGIICEKPIAGNLSEAGKICRLIKDCNMVFAVNFFRRWQLSFHKLKELIDKKYIGDIQNVVEMYLYDSQGAGSHQVDLNRYLFGEAKWVISRYKQKESFDCIVQHEKALINYIGCSQKYYTMGETNIWGTKGRIDVLNGGGKFIIYKRMPDKYYKKYFQLYPDDRMKIISDYKNVVTNLIDNMVDAIRMGKPLQATQIDGCRSLELLNNMKKASSKKRRVL